MAILDGEEAVFIGIAGILGVIYVYLQNQQRDPDDKLGGEEPSDSESNDTRIGTAKPESEIPGLDPASPDLGNIMDIAAAGSYFDFLVALHKEHGTIAKFWHGPKLMVSLASPELFRKTAKAGNRPAELFEVFSPLMTKDSLAFINGAEGRRRRAVYDHTLSFAAMPNYIPGSMDVAEEWVSEWREFENGSLVSVKNYTLRFAMKLLLQQLFSPEFFSDNRLVIRMQENFDVCWHELENRARGDIPAQDSERNIEFLRCRDDIFDVVGQLIHDRQENPPSPDEEPLLLDVVLGYCGEDFTTAQSELINFLIGGYMSSGDIMTWVIYFLSTHPDVQERLHEEIIDVLGKDRLSFESMPHMTYLKQVIDETLRASLIGTFVARSADHNMVLGGYNITAGTTLVQAMGVVHLDEQYYPDARRFDPDRFDEELVRQRPTHAFTPFGFAGGRKCPGYRLAYAECMVFVSRILQDFKMDFAPDQKHPEVIHGLISFLKGDFNVVLQKR